MKILKKGLLVIISIVFLLILGLAGFAFYSKPTYEGELQLKNIDLRCLSIVQKWW